MVPKGGQIPLDSQRLAAQGIFKVVSMLLLLSVTVIDNQTTPYFCWEHPFYTKLKLISQ